MTNNIEKTRKVDSVHLLLAIRRSKENEGQTHKDELCFREIIRDSEEETLQKIKSRISNLPGTWRIYHTVNARDTRKATKLLMHELLDHFEDQHYRVDSLYKKMLLQTACRKTKYFMLDIDNKDMDLAFGLPFGSFIPKAIEIHESPNGWHVVVEPFNLSKFKPTKEVTVIKDGYYFVEKVEVVNK